jgi:hypothetical protein
MDLRITGADQLQRLGRDLKAAGEGGKGLRRELLAEFRAEAKPVINDLRASAINTLPRRGGLGATVAKSNIRSSTRLSGTAVGLRITAKNLIAIKRINAGSVRHPLFGNRGFWYGQNVRAGWFDDPMRRDIDNFRRAAIRAMDRIAAQLN